MKKTVFFALAIVTMFAACNSKETEKLSGAGATFPEPFYKMAFKKFSTTTGNDVTYGAIGSGGGIRSLKDKTVDFGASDVFLSDKEISEIGADVIHVPTALGAVVISYNLKDVAELKLNAEVVSDIFLGKITKWNDEKIKALNAETNLPDKTITPVYRSDGSGTTAVFSEYMAKVNETWNTEIGQGKSLKFPVGVSAKGNTGVAGIVAETEGAMGYIGSEYALALNLAAASMQNSAGNFIKADIKSISAAANVDMPDDTRTVITNSSNPEAYPISTFTWIVVYKEQDYNDHPETQAKALKNLLQYIVSEEGQTIATQTNYAPLTGVALEKTKAAIESITYKGNAIIN